MIAEEGRKEGRKEVRVERLAWDGVEGSDGIVAISSSREFNLRFTYVYTVQSVLQKEQLSYYCLLLFKMIVV